MELAGITLRRGVDTLLQQWGQVKTKVPTMLENVHTNCSSGVTHITNQLIIRAQEISQIFK